MSNYLKATYSKLQLFQKKRKKKRLLTEKNGHTFVQNDGIFYQNCILKGKKHITVSEKNKKILVKLVNF